MYKRQGELLFKKIEALPNNCKEKKSLVIREGEITGHEHKLSIGTLYQEEYDSEKMFFTVPEKQTSRLEHPEHRTLEFNTGIYEVTIQREYTERNPRSVRD